MDQNDYQLNGFAISTPNTGMTWPGFNVTSGSILIHDNGCGQTPLSPECVLTGTCVIAEELVEYSDGEIFGYCTLCSRRVSIPRIAGAFNVHKLRGLIERIFSPDQDVSEQIAEFAELSKSIKEDLSAMDEAAQLLRLARAALEKNCGEKLGT